MCDQCCVLQEANYRLDVENGQLRHQLGRLGVKEFNGELTICDLGIYCEAMKDILGPEVRKLLDRVRELEREVQSLKLQKMVLHEGYGDMKLKALRDAGR